MLTYFHLENLRSVRKAERLLGVVAFDVGLNQRRMR